MLFRAVMFLALPAALAGAQTNEGRTEVFNGQVPGGSWLRVRTMKGDVQVKEATGRDVIVTATRRYRMRQTGEITFEVKRDGANVTVCAIWERTRRCDEDGYSSRSNSGRGWNSNEGDADFIVEIPRGVNLVAATGNGQVSVRGVGGDLEATSGNGEVTVDGASGSVLAASGNGDIRVDHAGGPVKAHSGNGGIRVSTTKGPVEANTGNGRIDVDMASLAGGGDMDFNTGNGSIVVTAPANLSANIESNVPYNNFNTDFAFEIPAHWNSRRIQGTIGGGGRRIRFNTGNGRVTLRKHD
ncbi:MAG: DUF4097 family beta strand repeat-containing protein [Gemmatimonadales bacterium]